jgi:hypothetical protein
VALLRSLPLLYFGGSFILIDERKSYQAQIATAIIGLSMTFDLSDTDMRKEVAAIVIDTLGVMLVDLMETEETKAEVKDFIIQKVAERFGEEER